MSDRSDLTRWNRSGLSRFEYIDGNAPTFLEELRRSLEERFTARWLSLPKAMANTSVEETKDLQSSPFYHQHLLKQYHGERGDMAWEIARAFAHVTHVLTAHIDTHANEGFLRTAREWDEVRKLVALIDYHPQAATSASTVIAIEAKAGKQGVISKGFQVKYVPPSGGNQIVFETLEDIYVDAALNTLRPKGWNESDAPVAEHDEAPVAPAFSRAAMGPAIHIEGLGESWASRLNDIAPDPDRIFRIKDFRDLDVENSGLTFDRHHSTLTLKKLKAKAEIVMTFDPGSGWGDISAWPITKIIGSSTEAVKNATGKTERDVRTLVSRLEHLRICLDESVFAATSLAMLIPEKSEARRLSPEPEPSLRTAWRAPKKPKVSAGQPAMVKRGSTGEAEAVTINRIDDSEKSGLGGYLHVLPSPVQDTWRSWKRKETRLEIAPRLKHRLWLNGPGVIRTARPHGLSKDAVIAWETYPESRKWQLARVIEADEWNLRLAQSTPIPEVGTPLYIARPLTWTAAPAGTVAPPKSKTMGFVSAATSPEDFIPKTFTTLVDELSDAEDMPGTAMNLTEIDDKKPPLLPPDPSEKPFPAGASFMFPSPMLPIDLVMAAIEMALKMGIMAIPSTGELVFKFLSNDALTDAVNSIYAAIANTEGINWVTPPKKEPAETDEAATKRVIKQLMNKTAGKEEPVLFQKIAEEVVKKKGPPVFVPADALPKVTVAEKFPVYVIDGAPKKLGTGDWVIGDFVDGLRALQLTSVVPLDDGVTRERFSVTFSHNDNISELRWLHTNFRSEILSEDSDVNTSTIDGDTLEIDSPPDTLTKGRKLLLMSTASDSDSDSGSDSDSDSDSGSDSVSIPVVVTVESRDGDTIRTSPPPKGFTKGELVILGNVVRAGHGVSKPIKRLSSGASEFGNREIVIEANTISTIYDPGFPTGARADIDVQVGRTRWKQAPRLDDSGPTDNHFAVRATQEGYLRLLFGDGASGRRLPGGVNNVQVTYRTGAGRIGNVPAGSLVKPVSPHPLVAGVDQPLPALGGEDMERVETIRERAPATLLALERSVSIADFENLAASMNKVWQARAAFTPAGIARYGCVTVVVVPAGGLPLHEGDSLLHEIALFLSRHAIPTVEVTVTSFVPQKVSLNLEIRVDGTRYDADDVAGRVRRTLTTELSLEKRRIGQSFSLAEVYYFVECVEGVSDSFCRFADTAVLTIEPAGPENVVFVSDRDEDAPLITIQTREYEP